MALWLACGAALAQDGSAPAKDEAQAAFDAAEKAWMDCEGLTMRFEGKIAAPGEKLMDGSTVSGTFHAAGSRCAVRMEGTLGSRPFGAHRLFDGERKHERDWSGDRDKGPYQSSAGDADDAASWRRAAWRGGVFLLGRRHLDLGTFKVSEVKLVDDEADEGRRIRHFTYVLHVEDQPEPARLELWLDASDRPQRRTLTAPNHPGGPDVTLTETYEVEVGALDAAVFAPDSDPPSAPGSR